MTSPSLSAQHGPPLPHRERIPAWLSTLALLTLLTAVAFLIQGFHSGIEDDEIYLPAIRKLVNPSLYPHDTQFFASQTSPFLLLRLVAASIRLTHWPAMLVQLLWQIASVFLVLAGAWQVSTRCFSQRKERLGGVALLAVLLTLPVAGTSLYITDQYLHPRTLASAALLFAIAAVLDRRFKRVVVYSAIAFVLHPLMAGFGIAYLIVLALPKGRPGWKKAAFTLLPLPFILHPNPAWREAAATREYFFLLRWQWFEWLGAFAPMVLLFWFSRIAKGRGSMAMARLAERLLLYSLIMSLAGLVAGIPARLDWLAPIQPMRHLQLVYLLMLLLGGGLLARYVLDRRIWAWGLLFAPLCCGMFYAQRSLFPSSPHIDVPGLPSGNRWVRCFRWISQNTPQDAYFAIDPHYMSRPGEENFGFRALAQRSRMADWSKDAGVVAVAPDLAPEWKRQVDSLQGYRRFTRADFLRLQKEFGVDWAVVEGNVAGLSCPYRRDQLAVCPIP